MAVARPRGPIVSFTKASLPSTHSILPGRTILLEKLESKHAKDLFNLVGGDDPARTSLWDYMGDGPYSQPDAFEKNIASKSASPDPFFFAIIDRRSAMPSFGKAIGYLSLMRIAPEQLSIEIGNVMFSSALQRTVGATEAFYLLARHAFDDLGYRRLEWKCDSLNAPSRRAALRLGHTYEGTFRQHMIVKGRSRDTAWFSMLKEEWNETMAGSMAKWLDETNFREDGSQIKTLQEIRGD
jgi:RimJ/RimL family protein N-acetyltransferase